MKAHELEFLYEYGRQALIDVAYPLKPRNEARFYRPNQRHQSLVPHLMDRSANDLTKSSKLKANVI